MAKRNVGQELDQFLDGHGYHHSRSKSKSKGSKTPKVAAPPPPPPSPPEDPVDLVIKTASQMESHGRYGHEKVFIAAIWDEIGSRLGMTLPEFKRWLIEQNRRRALTLARADLIGAMNPQMVTRSETQDRGATFHFVLDRHAVSPY